MAQCRVPHPSRIYILIDSIVMRTDSKVCSGFLFRVLIFIYVSINNPWSIKSHVHLNYCLSFTLGSHRLINLPTWSFHLATIYKDFEQCDFPALNLGTESLAVTPIGAMAWTLGGLRRARSRTISTSGEDRVNQAQARKAVSADRDCAIWYALLLVVHWLLIDEGVALT